MVEIRGGGTLDGAQLIDAASDSTLRELITTLQMQGKRDAAAKTDEVAKQVKAADIDAVTESYKKQNKQLGDNHESAKTFHDKLDAVAKSLGSMSSTLASKGITSLFDFFSTGMDSFRQLSNVGAGFNGNLTELSTIALNAGKSVESFTKEVIDNRNSLTSLGGNAEAGAKKLADIGNILNQGQFLSRFSQMGMTIKDINEVTQSYIETQTRSNGLQRQNSMSIAENTLKYAEAIDGVSRSLGMQRAELEKSMNKMAADPIWDMLKAKLPDQNRLAAEANMAAQLTAGGQEAAKALMEFNMRMPKTDLAKGFSQLGDGTQRLLNSVVEGRVHMVDAQKDINAGISNFLSQYTNETITSRPELLALKMYNMNLANAANAIKKSYEMSNDQLLKRSESLGTLFGTLTATMDTSWNRLKGALASTELFGQIEEGLKSFLSWLTSAGGIEEIKSFAGKLAESLRRVYTAMEQGYKDGSIWGAIIAGLKAMWNDTGTVVADEVHKLFQNLFPGTTPNPQQTQNEANAHIRNNDNQAQQQRSSWEKVFGDSIDYLKEKGMAFFTDLPAALTTGVNTARSSLNGVFSDVSEFMGTLPERIGKLKENIDGFIEGISLESISAKISKFVSDANTSIRTLDFSYVNEMIKTIRENLASGFKMIEDFTGSIPGRTQGIQKSISDFIGSISLDELGTKVESLVESVNRSIQSLDVSPTIERIKTSIRGFSDVLKVELDKINEMMKPGSAGPEAVGNFSRALGAFEAPLMSLINRISGLEGSDAQTVTASNISNILNSITNFIEKTTQGITTLQNLNPEKVEKIIPIMRQVSQEISSIFSSMSLPDMAKGVSLGASGFGIEKVIEAIQNVQNINFDKAKTDEVIGGARSMLMELSQLVSGDWWSVIGSFTSPTANISKIFDTVKSVQSINFDKDKTNEVIGGAQSILTQLSQLATGSWNDILSNFTSPTTNISKVFDVIKGIQDVNFDRTKTEEVITSAQSLLSQLSQLATGGWKDILSNFTSPTNNISKVFDIVKDVQSVTFDKAKTDEVIVGAQTVLTRLSELATGSWKDILSNFTSPTTNISKVFDIVKDVQNIDFNREKTIGIIEGAKTILAELSGLVEGSFWKSFTNLGTSSVDGLGKISQALNSFNTVSLTSEKANDISNAGRTISSAFNGLTITPGFFNNDQQVQQIIGNIIKFNNITLSEKSTEISSFIRTIVSTFNGADVNPGFFNNDQQVQQIISNLQKFQNVTGGSNELTTYARTIFATFNGMMLNPGFFNDTEQVQQVIGNIQKFQNINVGIIDGVVTSMNQLKGLGANLGSDIQGVSSFTESVSGLRSQLEASASAAERLKEAAGSIPGGVGGLAGANNAGGVSEATLQSTMGQVRDSLGRMESYLSTMAASAQATPAPSVTGR